MNLKHILAESFAYRWFLNKCLEYRVRINPVKEIQRSYFRCFQKEPDLKDPKDLIEKIYWLQLHSDTSFWSRCADKYLLRSYVKSLGLGEYLPALYGVWKRADDVRWSDLPNSFVIKTNNACGTVIVVKDKTKVDQKEVITKLRQWLILKYGYKAYQPHYLKILPCIIAEELLVQSAELDAKSTSIVDYKLWCINGRVESCSVLYNRTASGLCVDLYDGNWKRLPGYLRSRGKRKVNFTMTFSKPVCWEEMKTIASKLSKPFPQVRVDFYVINDKPVIGEMTFSSGYNGAYKLDYFKYLGQKLDLSNVEIVR